MEKINNEIDQRQIAFEKQLAYRDGFKDGFASLAYYLDIFVEKGLTDELIKEIEATIFEYADIDLYLWASETGIEMCYPKPDISQYSLFMARKRRLKVIDGKRRDKML